MNLTLTRDLALRYLDGKCSSQEISEVERLLDNPANQQLFDQVMWEHWNELSIEAEWPVTDDLLEKVHASMDLSAHDEVMENVSPRIQAWWQHRFKISKIAAVVVLAMLTSMLTLYFYKVNLFGSPLLPGSFIATTKAGTRQISLPDGTMVWLNSNSQLRYDSSFATTKREVYLVGEAFFDVTHQLDKPFVVHALDVEVRVLGTAFNVRSYAGSKRVETTLLRGKILIEHEYDSFRYELVPNEHAVYSQDSKEMALTKVDAQLYTSWMQSNLIFDEADLGDVLRAMELRYAVKIHLVKDQSIDCKLTAHIRSESLIEMLELLKSTTSISYEIKGSEVFIDGDLCN